MQLIRVYVSAAIIVLAGGLVNITRATGFNIKAGVGYDFFSQEYFLDSAAQAGTDSIFTIWSLKSNYLDDLKGMLSLSYLPYKDRRLELTTKYEQTKDFLRVKFLSDLRTKINKTKLNLTSELDWRYRYNDSADFGDSYLFGYSKAKFAIPVSQSLSTVFQVQGEFVNFDSVSSFNFNYYRLGGKFGFEKLFENFSFGDIKLTIMNRQVPDSTELNYLTFGLESSYFGFYSQGELDFFTRLEKKNYNQPDNKNNYYRMEFSGRNKVRLGENYFTRQGIEFELTNYDPADPINRDYFQLETTFLTGFQNQQLSLGVGPDFELLKEDKVTFSESDNYFEAGGKIEFDYMKISRFFISVESVLGYRNLKENSDLQTDYSFERLNLIGDIKFLNGLNFNFLFSAEWEWHEIKTNNSKIFLVSSSLTYNF